MLSPRRPSLGAVAWTTALFFVFSLSMALAKAQTVTGTITGTVTDPSRAAVPGATVKARNVRTGVDTEATSNSDGVYIIRYLPIGQYELTVTANGFTTQTVPAFSLEIDQTVKIDAHMTVGSATQTVS